MKKKKKRNSKKTKKLDWPSTDPKFPKLFCYGLT